MRHAAVLLCLLWCVPGVSFAAVLINEVAWMGNSISANDEWIELYNSGTEAVSLDGWILKDGMSLEISLSGNIAAGQYALLERTDDTSAPGVSAFLIYTGALSNTGATLSLYRSDAAIEDQVAGGENWESIGGDNVTKETAQYTASGWITALATPGKVNSGVQYSQDDEEDSSESSSNSSSATASSGKTDKSLVKSDNVLMLSFDVPEIIYINQPVYFEAIPSNVGKTIMNSLDYVWNFGDFEIEKGKEVSHVYKYPGEYIVTVEGSYVRHKEITRHTITVLPVKFSLTRDRDGNVQVHNDSPYEVDVSGFIIRGEKTIQFPEHSYIKKHGTITLAKSSINPSLTERQNQLWDQIGHMLAVEDSFSSTQSQLINSEAEVAVGQVLSALPEEDDAFRFSQGKNDVSLDDLETSDAGKNNNLVTTNDELANGPPKNKISWHILSLLGVISLGLAGVYMGSQSSSI